MERPSLRSTENSENVAVGRRNDRVGGGQALCASNVFSPRAFRARCSAAVRMMSATRLSPDIRAATVSGYCLGSR